MRNKHIGFLSIIFGILAMWLVVDHVSNFSFPEYFYVNNPGITYYVGVNVVSPIADFSFFTYHTLIMFSVWTLALGISILFGLKRLYGFCVHKSVMVFIFVNYLITSVLYTVFELTSGNVTFGLYALNGAAIRNFLTNILGHYVFFLFALFVFVKVKSQGTCEKKHFLSMSAYIFLYLIYVKLSGMYFYVIEWYPYPIFDLQAISRLIGLEIICPKGVEYLILLVLFIVMSYLYYLLLSFVDKLKKSSP